MDSVFKCLQASLRRARRRSAPNAERQAGRLLINDRSTNIPVIALTGATGFVGRAAVSRLQQYFPETVLRLLIRKPEQRRLPRGFGDCEIISGDLEDKGALADLVRDAECIIHLAAAIAGNRVGDFERPNVAGTRRLSETLSADAPRAHLVHLSSLAARRPELSWYAASKRAAEEVVASNLAHHSILRPPAVYGPGDPALAGLWRMLAHGWLVRPGAPAARFSMLHVDDLVEAICRLVAHGPTGRVMPLAGPQPEHGWSWSDIARVAAARSGRKIRSVTVPAPVLRFGAAGSLALARLTGRRAMLSPGKARELLHHDWVCDNLLIEQCLGWRPTTSLERTLDSLPGWSDA